MLKPVTLRHVPLWHLGQWLCRGSAVAYDVSIAIGLVAVLVSMLSLGGLCSGRFGLQLSRRAIRC